MYIESSVIVTINIVIILLFLWTIFKGFMDGFVATLLSLIASVLLFFIAWPISKYLAQYVSLYQYQGNTAIPNVINSFIKQNINQILWYILIVIFGNLIVKIMIKITKSINKTFIVGTINQILGLVLGFLITVVYAAVIGFILNSGIFKNGNEVIEKTVIKLYAIPVKIGTTLGEEVLKNDSLLISSIMNTEKSLTEEEVNIVIKSLQDKGVDEVVIQKLLPLIR